jgi:glycosyltransferase involved in cell wall biosynthesis
MNEDYFSPARVFEIELGQALPCVSARDEHTGQLYRSALCLVRLHSRPLELLELSLAGEGISAQAFARQIWGQLGEKINTHLAEDGLASITGLGVEGLPSANKPACIEEREKFLVDAPFVSVIVPTFNRPDLVPDCIKSLLSLDYPHYEVILVDNAPRTNANAECIQNTDVPQLRYTREDRPGVSWARNRGIREARGEIIAFTDDDVRVDRYWLAELVKNFSLGDDIGCVTGLTVLAELETEAQYWFEEFGGYSWSDWPFRRRVFDRSKRHVHLYRVALCGAGASMAFRADLLRRMGGFDPALGGRGPARSGQDAAAFFQVIMRGYKVIYEPASLAYHLHRRNYRDLRKQIYNYGVGASAYLTKNLLEYPQLLIDLFTKVPYALLLSRSAAAPKKDKSQASYPPELSALTRRGLVFGPFAYVWGRYVMRERGM